MEIKNVVTENVKLTQQINHNMQTIESSAQENNKSDSPTVAGNCAGDQRGRGERGAGWCRVALGDSGAGLRRPSSGAGVEHPPALCSAWLWLYVNIT
ncbi:hypothetical protein ACPA9J_33675 [Pseudomonas aeruginosa]